MFQLTAFWVLALERTLCWALGYQSSSFISGTTHLRDPGRSVLSSFHVICEMCTRCKRSSLIQNLEHQLKKIQQYNGHLIAMNEHFYFHMLHNPSLYCSSSYFMLVAATAPNLIESHSKTILQDA